jgi:amyloid beta precursor protein binding protein 1
LKRAQAYCFSSGSRLWGEAGQQRLQLSRILLFDASTTGVELLKNLILSGIGGYMIVDPKMVEERDIASSYFLTDDCLRQPRGECTIRYLKELNPEVMGSCIQAEGVVWVEKHREALKNYVMVISTEQREKEMQWLSKLCYDDRIPILFVRTYGFLGWMRLQAYEVPIMDPHIENALIDLQLACPFQELRAYVDSFHWDKMDPTEQATIPYIVMLIQCLDQWRKDHEGKIPETREEKEIFKKQIVKLKGAQENVYEAVANAYRIWSTMEIPENVVRLLEESRSKPSITDSFWTIMKALDAFVSQEHRLPLVGHLPDMKASTQRYIELQAIYIERTKKDIDIIKMKMEDLWIQRPKLPMPSLEYLKMFCQNTRWLDMIRYPCYFEGIPTRQLG